jgi:hypothetical protein
MGISAGLTDATEVVKILSSADSQCICLGSAIHLHSLPDTCG